MRKPLIYPLIFIGIVNNYTWEEIKFALNYFGDKLFPSFGVWGNIIIISLLLILAFTDENTSIYKYLTGKVELKKVFKQI